MPKLLAAQWHRLQVLAQLNKRSQASLRQQLLREFAKDDNFCRAVRLIAKNVLRKRVPLSKSQCCRLKAHKATLLGLYKCKSKNKIKRKRFASQSGGFLPWLIPLVASVVGEAIRNSNSD